MARKIYNVEVDDGTGERGGDFKSLWDTDSNSSVAAPDLYGLKPGGQVIVLETPLDLVNHYREVIEGYHRWLNESTDIFDPVMAQITMEFEPGGDALKLSLPYITDLALHHLSDEGLPVVTNSDTGRKDDSSWDWVVINPDNSLEFVARAQPYDFKD